MAALARFPPADVRHKWLFLASILILYIRPTAGQLLGGPIVAGGAQVKISAQPFPVANTQHLGQITWTMLGKNARETIYCVSEAPVSQLRFVCIDCAAKNITDMRDLFNSAEDLTRTAGFPTVQLQNVEANPAWTGVTIMCQAALNGGTIDSLPSTVYVRYLRQVHVVDSSGQGPVLIPNQGYHFYVECIRGPDGLCQLSQRRKTLHCSVQAYPPANSFTWLKNGGIISGNGPEITIGTEMIGHSIQCSANNGLFTEDDVPTSQAVFIDPYSVARLLQDNFQSLQSQLLAGNRVDINQRISLSCVVEGNPRPVVFWKLRRANGQVVDAPCGQGLNGQYQELQVPNTAGNNNQIRLNAMCDLQVTNYSFSGQYWCSACSYVSQGLPECSPGLDTPGDRVLNVQVQGPPQQSELEPYVEQFEGQHAATVYVHYCGDPQPLPPREVVFNIDGNDVQQGQTWHNFRFDGTTQNNTVPNCYFARLRIDPVHDEDQSRTIILKLSNRLGAKQITVPLGDLLGIDNADLGGVSSWVVALFVVVAVVILLFCSVLICMRFQMFCFDHVKDSDAQFSSNDKLKSGVHDTYGDDTPRSLFGNGSGGNGGAGSPGEVIIHSSTTGSMSVGGGMIGGGGSSMMNGVGNMIMPPSMLSSHSGSVHSASAVAAYAPPPALAAGEIYGPLNFRSSHESINYCALTLTDRTPVVPYAEPMAQCRPSHHNGVGSSGGVKTVSFSQAATTVVYPQHSSV